MKNIIITLQIFGLFILSSCSFSNEYIDYSFELLANDTYAITEYRGTNKEVIVPSTYKHKDITVIGELAFASTLFVKKITLPDTIVIIENHAFNYSMTLEEIIMPDTVEYIGEGAFRFTGLKSIILPSALKEIKAFTFAYTEIESLTIPEGVLRLDVNALSFMLDLVEVNLPESLTSIGTYAFLGNRLLERIDIPSSVYSIEINAFLGCESLTLYIPFSSAPITWSMGWNNEVEHIVYNN